jgi:hypothetical protein
MSALRSRLTLRSCGILLSRRHEFACVRYLA